MPNGKENRRKVKNTIPRGNKTQKQKLIRNQFKADIHVVSKKIENKKSLTYSLYQVLCRMRYM